MRLIRLSVRNFKGLREFVFEPDGQDCSVLGENASGKTTLFDAFMWLMFGKDSLNHADFEVKTLSGQGEADHGLEHEVEATLDFEEVGRLSYVLTLRKVLTENWVKKRGSAKSEFTGHTIQHFIDGVPVKEREYKDRISEICDEQVFRLLTNPRHFSENLKWTERRKVLLEACGDISTEDVIASNPKLAALPEILGKRSLDDHRKVLAGRRTEINKQLSDIPTRISETQRGIVAQDADLKTLNDGLGQFVKKKSELEKDLVTIETGGEIASKTKQLREVEGKLIALANEQATMANAPLLKRTQDIARLKGEIDQNQALIKSKTMTIDLNVEKFKTYQAKREELRSKWFSVNGTEFNEKSQTCPTCKQPMPAEMIQQARENFNLEKSRRLEEISKEGLMYKTFSERATGENEKLIKEREALGIVIASAQASIESLEADIAELKSKPVANRPEYDALQVQKAALESEISELQIGSRDSASEVKAKIADVSIEIEGIRTVLAQIGHNEKARVRIAELAAQERLLASEYETLESDLFLCELFIKTKVSMLTEKINSHFEFTRFVLFEEQINGGLSETCRVMVNGIPYENLNNAMRIQSGMDVIRTLQKHYGVSTTIFVDNRESIIELPAMQCQVISLIVSEAHKTLTVQMENSNERQAA